MQTEAMKYPWAEELEKTVVSSLTTSFGLDFLFFQDKKGGDVDTVNNARQKIWATDKEQQRYKDRETYSSDLYHQHSNYIESGRQDKENHSRGELHDPYRNKYMAADEFKKRDLDHVISAKEVHEDAGRILAELDGAELANQNTNLKSTHRSVNRSKGQSPIEEYLDKLPRLIENNENKLAADRQRLKNMSRQTPEQQHKARELESKINQSQDKIEQLKSVDPDAMRETDKKARENYDQQINQKYYSSSKFLKSTVNESGKAGLRMGTRQMLGLVLAEVWFELREQIPVIFNKIKNNFKLESFIEDVKNTLHDIWLRIKARFKDFLTSFKDGVFAGVMGSLTTTVFNIFATTQKLAIKIIREVWSQIVKAIKVIIFNPENLSFVDLCRTVVSIISVGVATVVGTTAYAQLLPFCSFPFGSELAAFSSALITGIVTLGINYALLYSDIAKKIWTYLDSIMPHAGTVKKYQVINAELDRYLMELSRIEFNFDVDELEQFSQQLSDCNCELLRGGIINKEITKRNIELPYEIGNKKSTRKWLSSLVK